MKEYRYKGTITVFLSLVSVLFLSLICTMAESARVQGARAWAAAVTDMALFSVFAEYEKEILADYDVLFLDGGYGTGEFQPERVALQMRGYMEYNMVPEKGLDFGKNFQLFPMEMTECEVSEYTLATDEEGSAFYQQVVENRKDNLAGELLIKYQKSREEARQTQAAADAYVESDSQAEQELIELEEKQAEQQASEAAEQQTEEGTEGQQEEVVVVEEPQVVNPLAEIKRIKELGILGLVVKDADKISDKSVEKSELPSGRSLKKGNLEIEKVHQGAVADGIFQDYLLDCFGNMTNPKEDGGLSYQAEYILMGKNNDRENLKAVVHRLLLMREGVNFIYAVSNTEMRNQAGALALAIAGAAPIPGLVPALQAMLLLAWAYGESLLDVRTLLSGGRIPLVKDESTWKLSLENLSRLTEVLEECDEGGGSGQNYVDYLRMLLFICGKSHYPMRALDMLEQEYVKKHKGSKADAWVVKANAKVGFSFPPVFLRTAKVFMNLEEAATGYEVEGCFGY